MKKPLVAALLGSLSLVSCGPMCIARGTLVWTPRGKRPIEDLIEQDVVWCIDPVTGEKVASPIIAIKRATHEVMRLSGAGFTLACTTDHPLYDPLAKIWAPAGDWVLEKRSSLLLVPDDGAQPRPVEVSSRDVFAGLSEVIDLTVMHELHNFVAAGVLVHNKSPRESCKGSDEREIFLGNPCTCADAGAGFFSCESNPDAGPSVPTCQCR